MKDFEKSSKQPISWPLWDLPCQAQCRALPWQERRCYKWSSHHPLTDPPQPGHDESDDFDEDNVDIINTLFIQELCSVSSEYDRYFCSVRWYMHIFWTGKVASAFARICWPRRLILRCIAQLLSNFRTLNCCSLFTTIIFIIILIKMITVIADLSKTTT